VPYSTSRASTDVSVAQALKVSLSVNKSWFTPGDYLVATARVTDTYGNPVANKEVRFYITDSYLYWIATETTDINGYASITWTVPWDIGGDKLPCTKRYIQAYAMPEAVGSDKILIAFAYPTRLSVTTDKKTYNPGEIVKVSVKLEYNDFGTWKPLAGRTVSVTFAGNTQSASTGSDGTASVSFTAPSTPGTYSVVAEFKGEGLATTLATALVEIITSQPVMMFITGALVLTPILAPIIITELGKAVR